MNGAAKRAKRQRIARTRIVRGMFSRRALVFLREHGKDTKPLPKLDAMASMVQSILGIPTGDWPTKEVRLEALIAGMDASGISFAGKLRKKPTKDSFYETPEWQWLRYQALKANDGRCELCGMGRHNGIQLHVDHIKPRSLHPELQLELSNLQVLCAPCNLGKSNRDDTDWRRNA